MPEASNISWWVFNSSYRLNASSVDKERIAFDTVLLMTSLFGTALCSVVVFMTFLSVNIRKKFILFGDLFLAEDLLAISRLMPRLLTAFTSQPGIRSPLVTSYECLRQVYPLMFAIAFATVPLPLCCIATQVFVAVAFPSFFRTNFSTKVQWYATLGMAAFVVVYGTVVAVIFYSDDVQLYPRCVVFLFLPSALFKGLPLAINCATCLMTIMTIVIYKRKKRAAARWRRETNGNDTSDTSHRCFIRWLYHVMFFTVIFNMMPTLCFTVLYKLNIASEFVAGNLVILLATQKSVVVSMTCLHFSEYRQVLIACPRSVLKLFRCGTNNVVHVAQFNISGRPSDNPTL